MEVSAVRWVFLICIFTILAFGDCYRLFAADRDKKPKIHSADFKGERENKFKTDESVYVIGRNFDPLTNVDIYVTKNRNWKKGDILSILNGTGDVSSDGVETVQTTSKGKIPKTRIWGAPIVEGKFDIVVDANRDGTFNAGDAVDDGSKKPGFKVKEFLR